MTLKKLLLGVTSLLVLSGFLSATSLAALTPDQQAAKDRGITLYNQLKPAEKELRIAAEAGDDEAQFYLGEELRHKNRYMTTDAHKWLEASANQGNLYAMLRLARSVQGLCSTIGNCPKGQKGPKEWAEEGYKQANARAEKGDAEAMYILYWVTVDDFPYLVKSAEAGFPFAQYWLARRYKNGDGFFWLPWQRSQEVERWMKAAAENGYPKAMVEYAAIVYEKKGDSSVMRHWIEESAKTGYESGIFLLASEYEHSRTYYGFPLDPVKAYGLTSLLLVLDGGGGTLDFTKEQLDRLSTKMTPEQIEQGKAFAKEWQTENPRPVSFFPMMLDPLDSF